MPLVDPRDKTKKFESFSINRKTVPQLLAEGILPPVKGLYKGMDDGNPVAGARVDLLKGDGRGTGIRANTDEFGAVSFQVLPGFEHVLKARVGSAWHATEVLTGGGSLALDISNTGDEGAAKPALAKAAVEEEAVFGLAGNYPNPFNPSTTIRYSLANASEVRLVVYNVLGQVVRELVHGAQAAGRHQVQWDGRDAFGREVATGMYISQLVAGSQTAIQKMTFAK